MTHEVAIRQRVLSRNDSVGVRFRGGPTAPAFVQALRWARRGRALSHCSLRRPWSARAS